ncbi:hypothetical protein ABFV99_25535 [Cytobacillus horneckiae]|uniref:hypothetical protein n=1 Tax=Cytobacillus horneckiae TaxID=549687 RepID=UPI002E20600D|nr:hypothetical protein [Cytobacillus horneckiae]
MTGAQLTASRERIRLQKNVETFLAAKGFRKETLSLLNFDSLMDLAEEYHFIIRN